MDRKTLLALNGGGQWTRDLKNGSCTMEKNMPQHYWFHTASVCSEDDGS